MKGKVIRVCGQQPCFKLESSSCPGLAADLGPLGSVRVRSIAIGSDHSWAFGMSIKQNID